MRKGMVILLLCMAAMTSCAQEDEEQTPFVLDSTTLVAENGERFMLLEDYADIIKKDSKILREYDKVTRGYEHRILDYGSFEILFFADFTVRNISIKNPGPRLLNGIGVGDPLEKILEDFQDDPRYRVGIHEEHSFITLNFTEFGSTKLREVIKNNFEPRIFVRYDENREVSFINAGWSWP